MKRFILAGLLIVGSVALSVPASAGGNDFTADGTPCTIVGTNGADVLVGTSNRDVICGLAGRDTITSVDTRRDLVHGGRGIDTCVTDPFDRVRRCELP